MHLWLGYVFITIISNNIFVVLFHTYIFVGITFLILFMFFAPKESNILNFNPLSLLLWISIIWIEIWMIYSYKIWWNLSFTPIFISTVITLLLIPVSLFFFKEGFSYIKLIWMFLSILWIFFIKMF